MEKLKDRQSLSDNRLYFRAVFGEQGDTSTLGILDETGGTEAGYDVAYVDENRNGDLTDDPAKKFPRYDRGSRAGQLAPRYAALFRKSHRRINCSDQKIALRYPLRYFLSLIHILKRKDNL